MKKLLISLFTLGVTSTSALSVISCGDPTHNRDFNKTNLQAYSSSEFSRIGILEGATDGTDQQVFEWNVARAFESDVYLPVVEDDFEFQYLNENHDIISDKDISFKIGDKVIFRLVAKQTSLNFEDHTEVIETQLFKDEKKNLSDIVIQPYLKDFEADKEKPEVILARIKRFNNHLICNSNNLEIVSVKQPEDDEVGKIVVKGNSESLHYTNQEFEFTYI
ncbi:hypothetical protein [Spiroplasma alleghenense]|uniref:Lipoprotein n=1 Tax=Spiroplasma alleghenense TaxID=216931 RepID=A0A345Z4F5_9MOLU|nr:hypothetical protein [Spiroplasma alleghenense]AXK51484.1 hypothetical protein SALLE_v1c08140 [Spiroplasma alleghenense]